MRLLLVLACLMTAATIIHEPKSHPMTNAESSSSSQEVQSLKNDIHDLEDALQTSRTRQDRWNNWYMRFGVAAIMLASLLGALTWFCQNKASNIELASRPTADKLSAKNAQLRDLLDKAAQIEVAKAQATAGQANTAAGKADESAGKAKLEAAEAKRDVVSTQLELAKQQEKTARAEIALLELQQTLADRSLTDAQLAIIANKLRIFFNQEYTATAYWDSPESLNFANRIAQALQLAHWKYNKQGSSSHMLGGVVGVKVFVHPGADESTLNAADALVAALLAEGIQSKKEMQNPNNPKSNIIGLSVGSKR